METVPLRDDLDLGREALVRVSVYLQAIGLPAASAEEQAKVVLQRSATPDTADKNAARWASAEIISQFDDWLKYLCDRVEGGCDPGVLAGALGSVLRERPDLFLRYDDRSLPIILATKPASRPPVPDETPAAMPAQAFDVPVLFRRGWRHTLTQWLLMTVRGATEEKRSR